MKKRFFTVILFCLLVLGSCFAKSKKELQPVEIDWISQTNGSFTYTVMPQYELLAIACRLAEIPGFIMNYNGNNDFLSQNDTLFAKYKDHKIVHTIKELNKKGISIDGFISLAYHIKTDFSGTTVDMKKKPATLNNEWKNISTNEINNLVKLLNTFAQDCNFSRIYTLNRGTYLSNIGYIRADMEKYELQEWATEFFTDNNPISYTYNISMIIAGYNAYDHATDIDNTVKFYLTIYPGAYISDYSNCLILCNVQYYVNDNWEKVKDHFSEYMKAFTLRLYPEHEKEILKSEITAFDLVSLISMYINIDYGAVRYQEENPDFYEASKESLKISFADPENIDKIFETIEYYKTHRDEYRDFKALYPKITELINGLVIPQK